jgi:hypothetical protein
MSQPPLEQLFGRSRVQIATPSYVEVFREAAAVGERRRYDKRFLATREGDFRPFVARESRVLAQLDDAGLRCVPGVAAAHARPDSLQTFDAGVTLEHWETLLRVQRDERAWPRVFADCAHWWALAHYMLRALEAIHRQGVVHLDVKPDNVCLPLLPTGFDPAVRGATLRVQFARLALIDFAFALTPAEPLEGPLPIARSASYSYQSPRLRIALLAARKNDLRPMSLLDWRCDMYSLAAMLAHHLAGTGTSALDASNGWTSQRMDSARNLIGALYDAHHREIAAVWPHAALIEKCEAEMQEPELLDSLVRGFELAPGEAATLEREAASVPIAPARAIDETPDAGSEMPALYSIPQSSRPVSAADSREEQPGGPQVLDMAEARERLAHSRPSRLRARAAGAVLLTLGLAAVGLGVYTGEQREIRPAATASNSGAADAPDSRNAPNDRLASASPDAIPSPSAPATAPRIDVPGSARTSVDTTTTQRPAEVAASDSPQVAERSDVRAPSNDEPGNRSRGASSGRSPQAPPITLPASSRSPNIAPATAAAPSRADDGAVVMVPPATVENVAARQEREVARVLASAGDRGGADDPQTLAQLARSMQTVGPAGALSTSESRGLARRLNAEAREAWERQDIDAALRLQQRAFRANANDPEVAGNLAFYYLKTRPAHRALARKMALYALAARGPAFPAGRIEDWGTFAVASSLEGRETDAARALYVMFTLSRSPERACRAAFLAVAQYGAALKAPAEAMLTRVRARHGKIAGAPSCG